MKILVYEWGSLLEPMYCKALEELQIEYVEYRRELKNYHFDAEFAQGMLQTFHKEGVQAVFSYDYFPLVAMLCEINKIPYMSWIYDCPQYTLWSKTVISPYNYIFCFDRVLAEQLESMGGSALCALSFGRRHRDVGTGSGCERNSFRQVCV